MSSAARQRGGGGGQYQYNQGDDQNARRAAALASARQRRFAGAMRPTAMDFFGGDVDEHGGSSMAMDVDDVDALEIFGGDGAAIGENKVADSDFFNSFDDDFDESDMISSK